MIHNKLLTSNDLECQETMKSEKNPATTILRVTSFPHRNTAKNSR